VPTTAVRIAIAFSRNERVLTYGYFYTQAKNDSARDVFSGLRWSRRVDVPDGVAPGGLIAEAFFQDLAAGPWNGAPIPEIHNGDAWTMACRLSGVSF
jgi:hypothetical protein